MTSEQDRDIRDYLRTEVQNMKDSYWKQIKWIIALIVSFMVCAISVGYYEVKQTERNKSEITRLRYDVQISVDWITWYRVNRTYELEFRAVVALINSNTEKYTETMEQFQQLRWDLTNDKVEEQRKTERLRGPGPVIKNN